MSIESARIVELMVVRTYAGAGTEKDPFRVVTSVVGRDGDHHQIDDGRAPVADGDPHLHLCKIIMRQFAGGR